MSYVAILLIGFIVGIIFTICMWYNGSIQVRTDEYYNKDMILSVIDEKKIEKQKFILLTMRHSSQK